MCNYQLTSTSPARPCQIERYLREISTSNLTHKGKWKKKSLPVDKRGLCIFHSHDIDWKLSNDFYEWMELIAKYFQFLETFMYMRSDPPSVKTLDLAGTVILGTPLMLQTGQEEFAIRFKNLKATDHVRLLLEEAEINDKISFENCAFEKVEICFNKCVVNGEMLLTNSCFEQLQFNDTKLNGGLLMNNCRLDGYVEFAGMKVQGAFQVMNTIFQTHVFFVSSNFRTESFYLDHVHFKGKADFNLATFHGDVDIQECIFEQILTFANAACHGPATFTGNHYGENVLFTSSEQSNKLFHDTVNFLFIDKEEEVQQRIIFDNVNYYLIDGVSRKDLADLARQNKVTIGSGCIKYRVQSPPINIKTNDINCNIAKELANSFTNYFVSSTGKNLGVEFLDKSINAISLFYFSDEAITQEEFMERLRKAEKDYWNLGAPAKNEAAEEAVEKIDAYVSKVAVLIKMAMLRNRHLQQEDATEEILKAINFDPSFNLAPTINIQIQEMKIDKIIAKDHSQVVIAENIEKIEYVSELSHVAKNELAQIREILSKLTITELQEFEQDVSNTPNQDVEPSLLEKLKGKLNQLAARHGAPLAEGVAASVIYDVLKVIFLRAGG